MLLGAWMPIRTLSPITESTEISISSPIMMLWFDFLVRTSTRFPLWPPQWGHYRGVRETNASAGPGHAGLCATLVASHGTQVASAAPKPDPDLDSPGPHRRLGRPSARGHGAADRELQ